MPLHCIQIFIVSNSFVHIYLIITRPSGGWTWTRSTRWSIIIITTRSSAVAVNFTSEIIIIVASITASTSTLIVSVPVISTVRITTIISLPTSITAFMIIIALARIVVVALLVITVLLMMMMLLLAVLLFLFSVMIRYMLVIRLCSYLLSFAQLCREFSSILDVVFLDNELPIYLMNHLLPKKRHKHRIPLQSNVNLMRFATSECSLPPYAFRLC